MVLLLVWYVFRIVFYQLDGQNAEILAEDRIFSQKIGFFCVFQAYSLVFVSFYAIVTA